MTSLVSVIQTAAGLAATHELHAAGFSRAQIAAALRRREILRPRQGWYAQPGTDRTLLAAARVGGRATCVTGLRLHGVWVGDATGLHVACSAHDARLRRPRDPRRRLSPSDGVVVHWRRLPRTGSRLILSPLECLRDALGCLGSSDVPLAADSLLHEHPALRARWKAFVADVPAVHRPLLVHADGICESGIETKIWLDLRKRGSAARRQVAIRGVGHVDFVVGRELVIEVDGEQYHTDTRQFEEDRRRDAVLASKGFRVLRLSYRQVTERWSEVDAALSALLRHPG